MFQKGVYALGDSDSLDKMFVFSGGIAKQTYVSSNGTMIICANGKAFNTNVVSGKLKIEDGGSAERAKVSGGGIMTVEDGGSAKDAEVGSGGRLIVSGGAQADNITVTEGIMYVMNDAVANYTIVNDGASMFVENNGKVLNTSVVGSKIEFVGHVHNDLDSYFTLTNNSVMVVGGGFWNHGVFNVESGSSISVVAAASGVEPRFNYGIINLDGGTLRLNDSSAASYYNKSAASISLTGGGQLFTDSNLTFIN